LPRSPVIVGFFQESARKLTGQLALQQQEQGRLSDNYKYAWLF
jgi:hypothetical protein